MKTINKIRITPELQLIQEVANYKEGGVWEHQGHNGQVILRTSMEMAGYLFRHAEKIRSLSVKYELGGMRAISTGQQADELTDEELRIIKLIK